MTIEKFNSEAVCLQTSKALLPIIDPELGGKILTKIASLRKNIANEKGFTIPKIRIFDSTKLDNYEYKIVIKGNEAYKGNLLFLKDNMDEQSKEKATNEIINNIHTVCIENADKIIDV